jgi:hypothetical protein
MKKKRIFASLLFVTGIGIALFAKADPPPGQCNHIMMWHVPSGVPSGEQGCLPFYCNSPDAWPFNENCYEHWGVPQTPAPPQCQ